MRYNSHIIKLTLLKIVQFSDFRIFTKVCNHYTFHCMIDHILFIHPSVYGYLGCSTFWLLWLILLWTFMYTFLFERMFQLLLGRYLGLDLLSHKLTLYLIFWGTAKLFSKAAASFDIPVSNVWGLQFLYILLNLLLSTFFCYSQSNGCEVIL